MIDKLYRKPGQTILIAKQRLWRTTDNRIVADGDPESAFLFCNPGQQVTLQDAERYGVYGGEEIAPVVIPEIKPIQAETKPAAAETKPIWPAEGRRRK